jgi:glycosyltransferase involved in cell wall biosynthesis
MTKGERLLVPWYRYPPFRRDGIGGLSVAVWELTQELAAQGAIVDVLTPPSADGGSSETQPGVCTVRSELGEKFARNQPLKHDENRSLDQYEAILSVNNYAARTLRSYERGIGRITRQIHTIGQDRGIGSYVSLKPTVDEFFRMAVARRKDRMGLRLLTGSKTICVSNHLMHKMQGGRLEDPRNLYMIPNGIQTKLFRPINVAKEYDVLFIGRFQKAKGLDVLFRALQVIQSTRGEAYKLAIVGEFTNEQRAFVTRYLPQVVREGIVFLGTVQREDMPKTISSAKLLVVPSRYESFGLPALEAMACGIPVVATRVGGLTEIVDETVGVLADPGNYPALARAIYTCIEDTSLADRVVTSGPAKAEKYDWRVIAPRILQVLFDNM